MIEGNIMAIAMVAHEANRAWCMQCGDDSQLSWNKAPKWQWDSAINGVKFRLENPDASDNASHDNWMKEKLADGWVYGDVKNAEAKTHPCLVPFDELPLEQQAKDALFRSIVHALQEACK